MNREYQVRSMVEEDLPAVLELLRNSLGEGSIPREREYWDWKHRFNPFGTSPALVATSSDRIVGLRVFMMWKWRSGGRDIVAVRAVDTATHPDWQGRGIFSTLTRGLVESMRSEGVALVFNTPNDQSRPGYLKMGWKKIGRVPVWVLPSHLLRLARIALKSRTEASQPERELESTEGLHAVDGLLDDMDFRAMLGRAETADSRFHTPRSIEYMRWRYLDIPGFTYFASWDKERAKGAAVIFQVRRRGSGRELRVCEILVSEEARSIRTAGKLIRGALRTTESDYAIAMSAPRTRERKVLLSAGFIPAPRTGPVFTVRNLITDSGLPDPSRGSSWKLGIGDLEIF